MNKYICKNCNHKFNEKDAKICPECKSENIQKDIPMFFGIAPKKENAVCKDGVCSIDD